MYDLEQKCFYMLESKISKNNTNLTTSPLGLAQHAIATQNLKGQPVFQE